MACFNCVLLSFVLLKIRKCSTWLDYCQIDGDKCFQQSNAYAAYDLLTRNMDFIEKDI
jgi:hypothetical protein